MSKLSPLKPTDLKLRTRCRQIYLKDLRKKETIVTVESLLDYVYGYNNKGKNRDKNKASTVGLSANQVGITKQISIVDLAIGRGRYSDLHVLINPTIIWRSKTILERSEGCVNLPYTWGFVKRSKRVKVEAYDRSGNKLLLDLSGWPAILLQHEIDHLNGILFIDRLDNPTKAHLVTDGEYKSYKRSKKDWAKFVNVTKLTKPISKDL